MRLVKPYVTEGLEPSGRVVGIAAGRGAEVAMSVLSALEAEFESSMRELRLTTLVMGPEIGGSSSGATLRGALVDRIRTFGASVEPEHVDLVAAARRHLGSGYSLDIYETHLVKMSDLVVIIPDSVGSFCELGLFAGSEFGPKFLILANEAHPKSGSYIADGPYQAARNNSSEIHFVNYTDHELSWKLVNSRLEKIRARMASNQMLGRG